MSGRETEKALGYITALDNARSEDKWNEVPELIRKVTKHAPHRKCLIETANAEIQVVAHVNNKRPSTAKGQTAPVQVSNLSDLIPALLAAIEAAEGTPQEVFQAKVCLAWIHWTQSEPALAISHLPNDFDDATISALSDGTQGLTKWTEVCIVKACYIKSAAQSLVSGPDDALKTASSILPRLTTPSPTFLACPQALHWSEKLLSKTALTASEQACEVDSGENGSATEVALKAFRLWSAHPQVKRREPSSTAPAGPFEPASQTSIWMSYYKFLSTILQRGMVYFPQSSQGSVRGQLASEIRRVEAACESVLLKEVKFPRANASNPQVESWVEQVIRNWEVLCGPDWRDEDLEGGQDAVGRNVLDILYRAATKTYHSHLILRRLFHVHAALADFELAVKALDSYIDIVVSAKERAEKAAETGEIEDDETLLRTVSEGVLLLCCFGSQKEAEKAKSLIEILEKYLGKAISQADNTQDADDKNRVSPKVIAMAYRAIGIGLANWSRWTPVNESRDDIRAEAIENLEKSISPELGEESNLSALYALALLLAESRDLDGSIEHVKLALSTNSNRANATDLSFELDQARLARERDLIPLWHLLALLLSAKQEYDIASRSCEAAFEQFPVAGTTFSKRSTRQRGRQDSPESRKEFLESLRGREKERILETRMTQLALIEILEGPEVAVNHSDQLLSLFATLFEHLDLGIITTEKSPKTEHEQLGPPKSSAETVKSFRGSIFARKKGTRVPERRNGTGSDILPIRESASTADAPTIQVTDEDRGRLPERGNAAGESTPSRHHEPHKLRKHEGNTTAEVQDHSQEPKTGATDGDRAESTSPNATPTNPQQEQNPEENVSTEEVGIAVSGPPPSEVSASAQDQSAKQPLPPVAHNMKHTSQPPPAGHAKQPPEQDIRLPTPHRFESPTRALMRFPTADAQKHALAVLVKVWLLIAGLYRRASLFDDAREACEEASKQAARFEALVAAQDSSARAFSERSWGVGKSSEELWGDVFAERGALSQAQSLPYEAMEHYEEAVMRCPDHPKATVGLANLLLDIWEEKIPAEPPRPQLEAELSTLSLSKPITGSGLAALEKSTAAGAATEKSNGTVAEPASPSPSPSPAQRGEVPGGSRSLSRLAARDRAYGLLSALTKRGSSWDDSEAWFALARAYEASGQLDKTKEVLWWCVELEDRKPIRHWWNVGAGGYVL
ncbi:hypothetical protein VTN77DRAFT_804 [Rasamsonia byssochlamydoides]|uniref:uncharacterized protein n=1 Tax=Rasamsonia byssochlamydoides TaxID=89139 RepID=UPI003743F642